MRQTVIFACVHNAGRSQMAAAFFNRMANPELAVATSAGTEPAEGVHPGVAAAMAEVGFDLSGVRPRKLTPELASGAAWLITMGCGENCPVVPGVARDDWPVPDPKGGTLEATRAVREQVRARVSAFLDAQGWKRMPTG
jgi:arsenate reductase